MEVGGLEIETINFSETLEVFLNKLVFQVGYHFLVNLEYSKTFSFSVVIRSVATNFRYLLRLQINILSSVIYWIIMYPEDTASD